MKLQLLIVASLLAVAVGDLVHSGTQSYRVKGQLKCGSQPAAQVRVKLIDDDDGPNPDDLLDQGYTDGQGRFDLSGDTSEITRIDPTLKIYHDCNDGIKPCQRRWKFELPNKYINSGVNPTKMIDIGTWNLEAELPDEERDCIHYWF